MFLFGCLNGPREPKLVHHTDKPALHCKTLVLILKIKLTLFSLHKIQISIIASNLTRIVTSVNVPSLRNRVTMASNIRAVKVSGALEGAVFLVSCPLGHHPGQRYP